VLMGSKENAAGLGIQCKYLTAQGISTAQYIHSDSGIIGLTNCPVLRKSSVVVDNG
ncbi:MAG: YobH family protein, partial [Enterobacter hormaechei]|nr:YobH family protein [Enterobacter hormaechei]